MWMRGACVGKGSFGTVNRAIPIAGHGHGLPSLMAVKSSPLSHSSVLRNEKAVLSQLQECPHILRFFFDDTTTEDGHTLYNVLLEYVGGGTLADRLARSTLPESDVQRYARATLEGLVYIHRKGFVHCDIKPRNLLLTSSDEIRIADFGLASKAGETAAVGSAKCLRGTPLYIAPECVARGEYAPAADVWSLGCVVAEMASGMPAWGCRENSDANALLCRIGFGRELPEIPSALSEAGKDFLEKCFVRDPENRWTAEMLLNHPFVAEDVAEAMGRDSRRRRMTAVEKTTSFSPRSAFDFNSWVSIQSSLRSTVTLVDSCSKASEEELRKFVSAAHRIRQLETGPPPSISSSWEDGEWITVREMNSKAPCSPVSLFNQETTK